MHASKTFLIIIKNIGVNKVVAIPAARVKKMQLCGRLPD
jgi:hypothetical protein